MNLRPTLCLAVASVSVPLTGLATEHRFTAYAGAEGHADPDRPAHGMLILAWDGRDVVGDTDLAVELNTDTLRFTVNELALTEDTSLNAQLTGEALIAGLSRDYWQDLAHRGDRTFTASYLQAQLWTKTRFADALYVEAEAGLRRWFFGPNGDETGEDFRLPPEVLVFEPRLRLTWWALSDDAAWHARHRLYPRLRGWALGVEGGFDLRMDTRDWGGDAEGPDPRNSPQKGIARVRPWALAGWQATPGLRWQGALEAGFAGGEDDLTRRRIGGLTPYVAQIPGVFWAHDLADRYVHVQTSLPVKLDADIEVGPMLAAAVLSDLHRTGDTSTYGIEWGAGAAAELRLGAWQVDARGGYSPSLSARADKAAWNLFLGAGGATE